jgi:exodeoxyribonuclease V alpha subunit
VIFIRDDYQFQLFNEDMGTTLPDSEAYGRLRVFFEGPDMSVSHPPPRQLPEYETVSAMTVHKSRNPKIEKVLLALGDESSPVMTRELLYTAITRGIAHTSVDGGEEAIRATVRRRLQRSYRL